MINKVMIEGRLVRPVEVRSFDSGSTLATARLAVDVRGKLEDGSWGNVDTTFVDVKFWGKRGEALERMNDQGDVVVVEGELRFEEWETREGEKRSKHVIVGHAWTFGSRKGSGSGRREEAARDDKPFG